MAATSEAQTISISIDRDPDDVYAYLIDPRNLPAWAAGLGEGIEERDGRWFTDTPGGPWEIAFVPENEHRVADHWVTQPSGERQLNPMRVLANGAAGSEVTFTLFRREAPDDEAWRGLQATIAADLRALRNVLQTSA